MLRDLCVCVCLSVGHNHELSLKGEVAEPIKMPFGMWTRVGQGTMYIRMGSHGLDLFRERGNLAESPGPLRSIENIVRRKTYVIR